MQAEEFISRYSAMEYDVKVAQEFHKLNLQKIEEFDTIGDVRDQVVKELNRTSEDLASANETIVDLSDRLDKEIAALKKKHWEEKDEM